MDVDDGHEDEDDVDDLGATEVEGVEERQVLHHQLQGSLVELCVGDIQHLEGLQFEQGHHHTELVTAHEGGVRGAGEQVSR